MECYTAGFPALHYRPEFIQTHDNRVGDALQPSHSLTPSTPALSLSRKLQISVHRITKSSKMNPCVYHPVTAVNSSWGSFHLQPRVLQLNYSK